MRGALLGAVLAMVASVFLVVAPVSAVDVITVDCSGKAAESAVCKDKNPSTNPVTGADGAIMRIANIIALVAGVASVIVIIVAGLRFVVAGGDSTKIAGARQAIIYAVVGLVIIASGRLIVGLIVGAL